jgi:hypothetical protein
MNVYVRQGSRLEKSYRERAGLPGAALEPAAIAPGLHPTPSHNLVFHGGKTIRDLAFTNFYIGGSDAWDPGDRQNIDSNLAAAMSDQNLNNVIVQYFQNQPITSTFQPSQVLPGAPPQVFSQGDVEALVQSFFTQGALNGDLGSTVFNFLLPPGAVLTTDAAPAGTQQKARRTVSTRHPAGVPVEEEESSTNGLGGYHGSIHAGPGGATTIYYAIGAFSQVLPDGTMNGIAVFDQPWKNVVATFYHELNEARTDADVEDAIHAGNDPSATSLLGWVSRQGEEVGDFPVAEANPLTEVFQEVALTAGAGTVPVQFQYSNFARGPEGPIPAPHPLPQQTAA